MRKLVKQLKELQNSINIALGGKIEDWVDVKTLTPIPEMPEQEAEKAIMQEMPRYLKAKTLGEIFAREITND